MCFCLILDKLQLMSRSLSKCLLFCGFFFQQGIMKPWPWLWTSKLLPASLEKSLLHLIPHPHSNEILAFRKSFVPENDQSWYRNYRNLMKSGRRFTKATTETTNTEKMDVSVYWDTLHNILVPCKTRAKIMFYVLISCEPLM